MLNGKAGYVVFSPFTLADSKKILVSRGWIESDQRDSLPELSLPQTNLKLFQIFELPLLAGLSRKSFIKKKYGEDKTLEGTLKLNKIALENGADIIRVHDVKENKLLIK